MALWLVAAGAPAAPARGDGPGSLFSGAYLLQVFGSLLIVFGCIFGLLYLLRKLNGLPLASGAAIRVLASARLGSREKVVLLEAGEKQLLVGVAAGNVRALYVFDEAVIARGQEHSGAGGRPGSFAALLRSSGAPGGTR